MKFASIQMSVVEGDKTATIDKAIENIQRCEGSDLIILPEILASLPITILHFLSEGFLLRSHTPYAEANFTASNGVKLSSTFPPIVPRIPEIDFIKVIWYFLNDTNILFT